MCCGRNRVASPLLIDRLLKYDLCDASLRCLLLVPIFFKLVDEKQGGCVQQYIPRCIRMYYVR